MMEGQVRPLELLYVPISPHIPRFAMLLACLGLLVVGPGQAQEWSVPRARVRDRPPRQGGWPAPPDVSKAPPYATKTQSGLAFKQLRAGDDKQHPGPRDRVRVQFTGWTSRGRSFASSRVPRGEVGTVSLPAVVTLDAVIPGWTEALQLLTRGGMARFWVPAALAYGATPTDPKLPAGDLVFDIELLSIERAPATPPVLVSPTKGDEPLVAGFSHVVLQAAPRGALPSRFDRISYLMSSWDSSGGLLSSSYETSKIAVLSRAKRPYTDLLEGMRVGEKRRYWWTPSPGMSAPQGPTTLSEDGRTITVSAGERLRSASTCYEVEIVDYFDDPEPPAAPRDVAAAPADATRTPSGLALKVLLAGDGQHRPRRQDRVTVHYTGWTKEGLPFDSSLIREAPASLNVADLIAGWTEGLELMSLGEKTLFWIPASLAYGEEAPAGKPSGPLVFEVELLHIDRKE